MRENNVELIQRVMDGINHTLGLYAEDWHHAPADWLLEQWWSILNTVKVSLDHGANPSVPSVSAQEHEQSDDLTEA